MKLGAGKGQKSLGGGKATKVGGITTPFVDKIVSGSGGGKMGGKR